MQKLDYRREIKAEIIRLKQELEDNYSRGQQRSTDDKKQLPSEYQSKDRVLRKRIAELEKELK